jgi:hypothetical protein
MCTAPVLVLPFFNIPFEIETDAYDKGVGAILTQNGHPVAFFSKALSVANKKLSTYEKEFLAVLMSIDKWRPYLLKKPFIIRTDHMSMCHLEDQTLLIEMQRKAMSKLAGLQFKLQYERGPDNNVVDALSRVAHHFQASAVSAIVPVWIVVQLISPFLFELLTLQGSLWSGTITWVDTYSEC